MAGAYSTYVCSGDHVDHDQSPQPFRGLGTFEFGGFLPLLGGLYFGVVVGNYWA
jgi:hypothetical protein